MTKKFIVVDPGMASHACGCAECNQCISMDEALIREESGRLWYYPFMDEPGESPFSVDEVIELDISELECLRPAGEEHWDGFCDCGSSEPHDGACANCGGLAR